MWVELCSREANPLTRIHHGTDIKEGITTNLGSNTDRNPFVCKDAGVNQTPKCFLRCSLIKVSVDTGVLVQNYPEGARGLMT